MNVGTRNMKKKLNNWIKKNTNSLRNNSSKALYVHVYFNCGLNLSRIHLVDTLTSHNQPHNLKLAATSREFSRGLKDTLNECNRSLNMVT